MTSFSYFNFIFLFITPTIFTQIADKNCSEYLEWISDKGNELKPLWINIDQTNFNFHTNFSQETKQKFFSAIGSYQAWISQVGPNSSKLIEDLEKKCVNKTLLKILTSYKTVAALVHPNLTERFQMGILKLTMEGIRSSLEKNFSEWNKLNYMKNKTSNEIGKMYKDLKKKWIEFHDALYPMKQNFTQLMNFSKKTLQYHGFTTLKSAWDLREFEEEMDETIENLTNQTFPLYQKLHSFVLFKLKKIYKKEIESKGEIKNISDRGLIPVHLLGDISGAHWTNLMNLISPYKNHSNQDLTPILQQKFQSVREMVKVGEDFLKSLGLEGMTEKFWNESVFNDSSGTPMLCSPSAFDMQKDQDFRISICGKVDSKTFHQLHGLLAEVEYMMQYRHQPLIFARGANEALVPALGETIKFFSRSPSYLHHLNLSQNETKNNSSGQYRRRINSLLKEALYHIPFLFFAQSLEKWRSRVFDGNVSEANYNKEWWKIRLEEGGVAPPEEREGPQYFDVGSRIQISLNQPITKNLMAVYLRFELQESLCSTTNHSKHPMDCDIFNSRLAGDMIRNLTEPGFSKPWKLLLSQLTGRNHVSSIPLLRYFKPLSDWLDEFIKNKNLTVGWNV